MENQQILLLGAGQWILDWCEFYNLEYVLIQKPQLFLPCTAKEIILLDYENDDKVWDYIDALCSKRNIVACLTATEPALVLAAQVTEHYSLPYKTCIDIRRVKEKSVMRKCLENSALDCEANESSTKLPYALVNSVGELERFLDEQREIIVKPNDGVGSQNIFKFNEESKPDIQKLQSFPMLAEKYIGGKEYSVEAFSDDGEHHILAITEKTIDEDNFVEKRHMLPANIDETLRDTIHSEAKKFLDVVGIINGPSHTEFKTFNNEIFFIETHNRVAGDSITYLLEMVTGVNIFQWMIGSPVKKKEVGGSIPENGVAIIEFIFGSQGHIKSISGLDSARTVSNIVNVTLNKMTGDRVENTSSSYDRLGYVIAFASNKTACELAITEAKKRLKIEIL